MQVTVNCDDYQVGKAWRSTKEITVPQVSVLDPACGTGTFHAEIIKYIKESYIASASEPFFKGDIGEIVERLIGFEIMMTSYAVAHLNVRRTIEEVLDEKPQTRIEPKIYMTNTLSQPKRTLERNEQMVLMDFTGAIPEENYNADTWKARRPIKVIIGNPPYLAASTNPFVIDAYKLETDGKTKLQEKNPKWLNDDYVKFFRFAEQIISKHGEGVLAFVSNNGYLDNPTFRGMRASLLRTFDKIFVINLHGSAKKKETAPDGSPDQNIFDIMQGVSLFVGVKTSRNDDWAKVYHADLWGLREAKFSELDAKSFAFTELALDPKWAYFVPYESDSDYENGVSVAELFPTNVVGLVSGKDDVAIAPTRVELERRMDIVRHAIDDKPIVELWGGTMGSSHTVAEVKNDVLLADGAICPIAYRPFDTRWTYYSGRSGGWITRPREKRTLGHLQQDATTPIGRNVGMVFCRLAPKAQDFAMISICDKIIEAIFLSPETSNTAAVAPLFLHNALTDTWEPNLNPAALAKLTANLPEQPTAAQVFDYVYGILHDPAYRERYNEFLKRDFPRVPVIEPATFGKYVQAGKRLRKLHLLQEKVPAQLALEPATADDLEIGAIKYKDGVLHLNANKRILGITPEVWAYRIGGYQVLDKWFKSHRGEMLGREQFLHIAHVAGLLAETIKVQEGLRW